VIMEWEMTVSRGKEAERRIGSVVKGVWQLFHKLETGSRESARHEFTIKEIIKS
jgi:hypothetical protein